MKLYAKSNELGKIYILSQDAKKDARQAEMTVDDYVKATKKLNPQFDNVWTV